VVQGCQTQVSFPSHSPTIWCKGSSIQRPFKAAPTLQQLLRFLATRALEEHTDEIKEYTIGVEAPGRKPDFDPKTDPIVRVQVNRLRQKLIGTRSFSTRRILNSQPKTDWAALHHVPVGHNVISVRHPHAGMTTFSNESGPDIAWRVSLPGKFDVLLIDGKKAPAESATRTGGLVESYQVLQVRRGETHVVSVG
jgi:hypothetical protein